MVVPDYKDIYDFSPIQYPANDKKSGTLTTHFDYHSIMKRRHRGACIISDKFKEMS